MNKKKLSVVMAGAMLASSVSPVLAATESELDTSRLGSLVEKVHAKLISERFTAGTGDALAGKSVYYVKKNGTEIAGIDALTVKGKEEALRLELQEAFKGLSAGDEIEIWTRGTAEDEKGNIVSETVTTPVYTNDEINATLSNNILKALTHSDTADGTLNGTTQNTNLIADAKQVKLDTTDANNKEIRIYFNKDIGMDLPVVNENVLGTGATDYKLLVIKAGTEKFADNLLTFFTVSDSTTGTAISQSTPGAKDTTPDNKSIDEITGFKKAAATDKNSVPDKLIETVKITGVQHSYKTEELYDGLMLTTEGHDLLSLVKDVRNDKGDKATSTTAVIKNLSKTVTYKAKTNIDLEKVNSEYGFILVVTDAFGKTTEYTVKGAEKQTEVLASWLNNELAKVDILAGDNRYETAVEIAKEQARVGKLDETDGTTTTTSSNIVLVNGTSLVDGLAAAPLAADLTNKASKAGSQAAPILLTEADALPKATKAYLKELLADKTIGDVDTTVHLVGGTTVLNRSLEKELKAMGFDVVRYGGDNREETSLKVAKEIDEDLTDGAFVVGAEGEADAMSISGYASMKKMPVIVAKKGGISYDALDVIEGKTVTVIGGEASVSAEDYEAIKEEADAVRRISGENRQATNAAIIKEFYHAGVNTNGVVNQESVIVAKDGRGNKTELVDALTAANLAAQTNAPVVLAKSSLTADQIDALQLRGKSADSLYQVGIGVERSVMETIASKLGLLNK